MTASAARGAAAGESAPSNPRQPALRFDAVWKRFALHHERARSFQELWIQLLRRNGSGAWEEFWAIQDVSFEVWPGQMVGIIGPNGSGKSTLLRLAARTLRPTRGQIVLWGRVAPLLELGAGFHPELTGQENVYLNGRLLGLDRSAVSERFADIVRFAELEQFIDTPMKHYSSGMWLRLGFAVAAHTDAEILLIDESLAVGDAAFQQKCLARMEEFRQRGRTILLVSHRLDQVATRCDRAIWMESGRVRQMGAAREVVAAYEAAAASRAPQPEPS